MADQAAALKLTKADFKAYAVKILSMAQLIASFTPTQKDDQAVALLTGVVNNPDQFDQLCAILGITD